MANSQVQILFPSGGSGVNTLTIKLDGVEVDFVTINGSTPAANSLLLYNLINDDYSASYDVVRAGPVSGGYRVDITAREDNIFYNFDSVLVRDDESITMTVLSETFSETDPECTLLIGSVTPTAETGDGLSDGSVDSSISGAFGTAYYSINGEDYVATAQFTGLVPGEYIYYVRDENDCEASAPFTIEEFNALPPEIPTSCFNPVLIISELNPYRFVIKHCNPLDDTEKLYSESDLCGVFQPCYFQPLNCNDVFTIQLYYLDEEFGTIPVLKIVDAITQEVLYTLDFTNIGSGYYKIEKNVSELPDICEKRVYLEVKSASSFSPELEYYVHARSEGIHVSNYHDCNILLEYWNDSDYNEIKYTDTGYINKLRLEAIFDEEEVVQDIEVYVKSNGYRQPLSEEIHEVWNLEVNHAPYYLHKKIALALSHQHVRINGREYVKEEPYIFDRIRNFALRKGTGKLSNKSYQSKNLIY